MTDGFDAMPSSLRANARLERFGDIPVLLAHPTWDTPAGTVLWLHGRTVSKELDPGRYLRWIRAGLGVCAIDLPGHGERFDARLQRPRATLEVLAQAVGEFDQIVAALAEPRFGGVFDGSRLGIGGMSAGGMAALRRLCDPHPFKAASVEGTTGWLGELYHPTLAGNPGTPWGIDHPPAAIEPVDPMAHLATFEPIPLLALHSQADEIVPWASQRAFLDRLADHYRDLGADPGLIEVHTWEQTGAPREHAGFGRVSAQAKSLQVEFLAGHLAPG